MKKKVLVVEDELDVAKVVSARLRKAGYEVIHAEDGIKGVEFAHKHHPDLIVLDLCLPGAGGQSVFEQLQSSADLTSIPVIILTGIKDKFLKDELLTKGVSFYLEKPYNAEELLGMVKKLLSEPEGKEL